MRQADRTPSGFTLLELLVTISTGLVLASLGTSSMSLVLARTHEKQDIVEFGGYLREARSIARSRLREVRVTVGDGEMLVEPLGGSSIRHALGGQITEVKVIDNDGVIVFNQSGGLDEQSAPVIQVAAASGRAYTFTILPAIGTLRVGTP